MIENKRTLNAKRYLHRFDEILEQMANKMLTAQFTDNITLNFIECMIPHHQAAIYMSQNLLQYTNYLPLREIAQGIIEMQEKGIEQMKEIAKNTTARYNNLPSDVKTYINNYLEITNNMINQMKNSPRCININLDFINEMIPHHKGAIAMCENLLKYYINPRLKIVAETIIQEQSQGVRELEQTQKKLCSAGR